MAQVGHWNTCVVDGKKGREGFNQLNFKEREPQICNLRFTTRLEP
jgi:hypothetical protein